MEYFNRYTKYGEKTGEKVSRTEAHEKGICHRVFHLWLVNSDNQILIQQRSAEKDTGANLWYVSVGGHLTFNELLVEAMVRETQEELGLDITPHLDRLTYLYSFHERIQESSGVLDDEFYDVFALKMDVSLDQIVMQESEVQAVRYMDYAEFKALTTSRSDMFVAHEVCYQLLAVALDDYVKKNHE